MIIFLNFAPLNFGGGAERWMLDVSSAVNKLEKVTLVDVHPEIANLYGQLVLKRKFNQRINLEKISDSGTHIALSLQSFVPFFDDWKHARNTFQKARCIYMKYELLEILIVLYFGGISALKKTMAGIHSSFIYQQPLTFFDYLHNFVYNSFTSRLLLSKMKKIHVINPNDYKLFTEKLDFKNVVYVPNFIDIKNDPPNKNKNIDNQILNIAFVGELTIKKGVDILIEVMKQSSDNYIFHIAGDGPMRDDIKKLSSFKNVRYYGYLSKKDLLNFYTDCDIIFVPSRAESFSLVCLEAMSYGLPIVSSAETDLELPAYIQSVNKDGSIIKYLHAFKEILINKQKGQLNEQKNKIKKYVEEKFSRKHMIKELLVRIFEL